MAIDNLRKLIGILLILISILMQTTLLAQNKKYLLPQDTFNKTVKSGFQFDNFIDFVYIRDSNNINIVVSKKKIYHLKPGKYYIATAHAELGEFKVKRNRYTKIDAHNYLQIVNFKNITDKAYIYKNPNSKNFLTTNNSKQVKARAIHSLVQSDPNKHNALYSDSLQLPYDKYRLVIDGNNNSKNYIDFTTSKNEVEMNIDLSDYFGYLQIPTNYKKGRIHQIGTKNYYIKCCTLRPSTYAVYVDDQLISTVNVEAGTSYEIASQSNMSNVRVNEFTKFKISGNGISHDFGLGNAKKSINLVPNKYLLSYTSFDQISRKRYIKELVSIDLLGGDNLELDPYKYLGKIEFTTKSKTKNTYFSILDSETKDLVKNINALSHDTYLPEGKYSLISKNEVVKKFSVYKNETTTINFDKYFGNVLLSNTDRSIYNAFENEPPRYVDQIKTFRPMPTYLLAGHYCLREKKDPHNGFLGKIIKCFEIKKNKLTVVDMQLIDK